jgi:hypothetical protein
VVATIDPQENSKQSYIVNDEIGNVVFVLWTSLFNIYFLTVILLSLFEELFMFPLIYYRQLVYTIYLQAGWKG